MKKIALLTTLAFTGLTGCASVNMAPKAESEVAKSFNKPSTGQAGVYVYRTNTPVGAALKKDIWINDECIGESAKGVFFYHEVEGGKEHTVKTESEFSPNTLELMMEAGKKYFIEQYIKIGVFVGGANLRQVDNEIGKEEVSKLDMAAKGSCSSTSETTAKKS